ncbi:bifunctional 2-polyprenyl-6-hydroxyphenol methylase/3-demethylubiquinol 3-O-methyltransferase UbiG [Aurantimonas sp. VKM B-3413]|uniref:class I SAM-dependent methyltransferase n=1 Tax=Aurantimonas sp. VKM B-3413 TaxID=2779401 RepID=UPI001E30EE17|nr:class I SAM-dependent methyltransferase [Aurantimonas sp. VKM B-3413]MCB8838003.1 class I SAM-dependent methyltransferase [Aurantimonas sp. VKM B-3413]
MQDYFDANRANWDERAELHSTDTTGSYRIGKVLAGGSSLHAIEAEEVGDVAGLDVVHLQCHIGLDTLSLKHLGARSVTGLDFSPKAIAAARDFAARAGTEARFVEASLTAAPEALGETYDLAFVTWGAINWLPDIGAWAKVVAKVLRPGGRLYLLEGHPVMNQMEWEDGRFVATFDRATPEDRPLVFDEAETYTGDARKLTNTRNYEWLHPVADVVSAVIDAGLRLDFLHEHDRLAWRAFPNMIETGEDLFELPEGAVRIPLAFSLGATKRA